MIVRKKKLVKGDRAMVFYVVKKVSPPQSGEERYGPFESQAVAQAKARTLAEAKPASGNYQVVCDYA